MADQPNIFDDTNKPVTPAPQGNAPAGGSAEHSVNPLDDLLKSIKNEHGAPKYSSAEEALKGAAHAQEYIQQLKADNAAKEAELALLRGESGKQAELERTVQELMQKISQPANQSGITADQVAELVKSQLSAQDKQKLATQNTQQVVNAVKTAFGDEAGVKFYQKAAEMGMSNDEFNALAARSPQAVLTLFGIGAQAHRSSTLAPSASRVNTASFEPQKESFVGRNKTGMLLGSTTSDLIAEGNRSKSMVDELHAAGLSVHDLSDPKVYAKYFGK